MMLNRPSVAPYFRGIRIIFILYSAGFLIGTYTHSSHVLHYGLLAHPVPLTISVYWDALTLLDPLTVLALWWKPKTGILLALGIMASDISLNTYTYLMGYFGSVVPKMVPLSLFEQALFGLFVFITAPLAYQQLRSAGYRPAKNRTSSSALV